MKPVIRWFNEIYQGLSTAVKGMAITFRHLFREPVTVQYPEVDVQAQLPERYRGILHVDMHICISCHLCARACPIDCIAIEDVKGVKTSVMSRTTGKPNAKVKYSTSFLIDISKCMFCGLCVEPCPTGAIYHTNKFEGAVTDMKQLVYEYVGEKDIELAKKQEAALEAQQAEKVKQAQAAKEAKEAEEKP